MKFPKWFTKFFINPFFGVCVLVSFLAAGAWITSWSYFAESHKQIGLWTGIAIGLSAAAIFLMVKASNTSRGGNS